MPRRTQEMDVQTQPEAPFPETFEFDVTPGHKHRNLRVRWVGREVVLPSRPIETPSGPYAIVKYCVKGRGVLDWEFDRWEVEPGMIFWSTARNPNTIFAGADTAMTNVGIFLAGTQALQLIEQLLHSPVGAVRLTNSKMIGDLLEVLISEVRGASLQREDICALLAEALLRRIAAQAIFSDSSNRLARQAFHRCRQFIERNFVNINSLKDVAEACDVTVPYLCRLFDQFFECSAYALITRLKMSRAEWLLLSPSTPVHEVAHEVGYKDARLFARNFKAAYGKSPTTYRESNAVRVDEP